MHAYTSDRVLSVSLSTEIHATSKRLETKSGLVRWALLEGTLLIQPEHALDCADTPLIEHIVRTVMKSSGLARRYQIFSLRETDLTAR